MNINKYSFKNIGIKTLQKVREFVLTSNIFAQKAASLLSKDVFELSAKKGTPEILANNPGIIEDKFYSGINDNRFKYFSTEYRAYSFEGYDTQFPTQYVCIDSKGQRRLKPHIFLSYVEIKPEFARQGAYSSAIKKLKAISSADPNCEGRIILNARKIENNNIISSPSLAHWKCGFRFADEKDNKTMRLVLNGELPPSEAPEGYMYYAFI